MKLWRLPISFLKMRFSCNQNIGEAIVFYSSSELFWKQNTIDSLHRSTHPSIVSSGLLFGGDTSKSKFLLGCGLLGLWFLCLWVPNLSGGGGGRSLPGPILSGNNWPIAIAPIPITSSSHVFTNSEIYVWFMLYGQSVEWQIQCWMFVLIFSADMKSRSESSTNH